jgi:hypothetical protein
MYVIFAYSSMTEELLLVGYVTCPIGGGAPSQHRALLLQKVPTSTSQSQFPSPPSIRV